MITVHSQLSESELISAIFKVRRWMFPQEFIKGTFSGAIGSILIITGYLDYTGDHRLGKAIVGLSCVICLLPAFYFITRLRVRRRIIRQVRNDPYITLPGELSFDEARVVLFKAPSRRSEFTWSVFTGRKQDKHYFYLFSGPGSKIVIAPKRAFDDTSLAEFLRCGQFSLPT